MNAKNRRIFEVLAQRYPDAHCELLHETPFQLLISTVLSAQTTDVQVNKVMPAVYERLPDAKAWLSLSLGEIEETIKSIGLYKSKARHIYALVRMLLEEWGGEVPRTLEELTKLPGVGRKTANVVLANAYGVPSIAVDTHVFRLANRIGIAHEKNVAKTEAALQKALDPDLWIQAHHLLIFHGRALCTARSPKCDLCPIRDDCDYDKSQRALARAALRQKAKKSKEPSPRVPSREKGRP
ncbi:Endonuclease III [Clostridiaceae bacterium JG1575]|nr:Endonuclease III [Clostridiaceae bacterium JG1575]